MARDSISKRFSSKQKDKKLDDLSKRTRSREELDGWIT